MVKDSTEIIQAFPIQSHTYVGTAASMDVDGFSIIHVSEDCDLTFDFGTAGVVVVSAIVGQDFAIGDDCQALTSTAIIIVS